MGKIHFLLIALSCISYQEINLVTHRDEKNSYEVGIPENWEVTKFSSSRSSRITVRDTANFKRDFRFKLAWQNDSGDSIGFHGTAEHLRELDKVLGTTERKYIVENDTEILEHYSISSFNKVSYTAIIKTIGKPGEINFYALVNDKNFTDTEKALINQIKYTVKVLD